MTTITRPTTGIINYGGGGYKDSQVNDPCVFVNPSDSGQLVMMYMTVAAPPLTGDGTISRATANVSGFVAGSTWTEGGSPVINEAHTLRPDTTIVVGSTIHLFTTAYPAGGNRCDKYTSTDAGLTWSGPTTVLEKSGDETFIANFAVIKEGSAWTMIYTASTSSSSFDTRKRYATSSDGSTWTKGGVDLFTCGPDGDSDHFGLEWSQVIKNGDTYILCYEAAPSVSPFESPGSTTEYGLHVATSRSLTGGWSKSVVKPAYAASGVAGRFDEFHTATGAFYQIGGVWYLFHCGGSDAGQEHWDLAVATLSGAPEQMMHSIGPDRAGGGSSGLPVFGS